MATRKCITKKNGYRSRIDALITLARIQSRNKAGSDESRAYKCNFCGRWHLTSKPFKPNSHL